MAETMTCAQCGRTIRADDPGVGGWEARPEVGALCEDCRTAAGDPQGGSDADRMVAEAERRMPEGLLPPE